METLKTVWTGVRPLLMHSARLIDPDDKNVKKIGQLQAEKKQNKKENLANDERIRREIERAEWEGSLYWLEGIGLMVPGDNIFKCIVEGARKLKLGKQAESGVLPIDDTPITTQKPHPKNLNDLFALPEYSFRFPVRIPPRTGSRIMKVRPIVPTGWKLHVETEYDEKIISREQLFKSEQQGGAIVAIGNWRPKFGRFTVEVVE